jgi:hypothetical protein
MIGRVVATLALAALAAAAPMSLSSETDVSSTDAPDTTTTAVVLNMTKPASTTTIAPETTIEAAPADAEPAQDTAPADAFVDPAAKKGCKHSCTPKIDVKASVIESYKRHRAQVAVIGDYGSCKAKSPNTYTWSVNWGDDEVHERTLPHIGPYQSTHTYAKKGKYDIEITFCSDAKDEPCDAGCTTMTKKLNVKP